MLPNITYRRRIENLIFRQLNCLGIGLRINAFNFYNGLLSRKFERFRKSASARGRLPVPSLRIDPDRGIAQVPRGALPHTDDVLSAIDSIWREEEANPVSARRKEYLRNILRENSIDRYPVLLKFATSPELVSIVTDYLGEVPTLSEIMLWISDDPSAIESGSQMYHRDTADKTQVKLFFHGNDIGVENGPLNALPRLLSRKISARIGYWTNRSPYYVPDAMLLKDVSPGVAVTCIGERGTGYFVDTSQCFHYGSRSPTKPRCILMLQYTRLARGDLRGQDFRRYRHLVANDAGNMVLDDEFLPLV